MGEMRQEGKVYQNTTTGTTSNDWNEALKWYVAKYTKNVRFAIKNLDPNNALEYNIYEVIVTIEREYGENRLSPGNFRTFSLVRPASAIVIKVKSAATDSHARYQIDYLGVED